jgi:large subunit ribosomal protein L23
MLIIEKPIITEKSLLSAQDGVYTFAVNDNATKPEVAKAITKLYGVEVTKVRVMSVKGHPVRSKTGMTKKSDWKKALVTLKAGQKIKEFDLPEDKSEKTDKSKEETK